MQDKNHNQLPLLLLLLLTPSYVAAQDTSFKGNSGEPFTPSTVIIIIMGIIFVFTGCLAVFLRQFSDGCFGLNVMNPGITSDGQLATTGLDPEFIKSLPTYFYADVKQHRKGQVELECAICLTEFQDPEALRLLPGCSHVFHPRCIDQWLTKHVTCPVCRHSLDPVSVNTKNSNNNHTIINISTTLRGDELVGSHRDYHCNNTMEFVVDDDIKKTIVGKFPRSHSTGHSIADYERFTLVLPEDVQNNIPNRSKMLRSMLSPRSAYRCGWFAMTPPIFNAPSRSVRSMVSSGLAVSSSKNMPTAPPSVKTSDRLWPI